ncbi:MAG: hypothetical protein H8K10_12425 [Nitrospira sp.]|nr:hypothetical protein [Nitrospira sp.]
MQTELLKDLIESVKTAHRFPPANFFEAYLESPGRQRNITRSDVPHITGSFCLSCITEILESFSDLVIQNLKNIGLQDDVAICDVLMKAEQELFTEARALLKREFPNDDWLLPALSSLDAGQKDVVDRLMRKIKLRKLNMGFNSSATSVRVTESQNVNVVIGSLETTVHQMISKGGTDEEIARLLQDFIQIVEKLESRYKDEQMALLGLTKGIVKEIESSPKERNLYTLGAVFEQIRNIGATIGGAGELTHFLTVKLPELLRLIGLG